MSIKPKKARSRSSAAPDDAEEQAPASPRRAKTVRDHSGGGERPSASGKTKGKGRRTSGKHPAVARRRDDPSAGIWTPAILAVPVGLIVVFAIVFMLLVRSSTNAPPVTPAEEAPAPPPRPVVLDPEPTSTVPAPTVDPDEPAPDPASADEAPPIEGDE